MKRFIRVAPLACTALLGVIAASGPANAQSWMDVARQPVPSYQPFRGYAGSQTYIGQDYSGGAGRSSNPVDAVLPDQGQDAFEDGGIAVHEALDDDCL